MFDLANGKTLLSAVLESTPLARREDCCFSNRYVMLATTKSNTPEQCQVVILDILGGRARTFGLEFLLGNCDIWNGCVLALQPKKLRRIMVIDLQKGEAKAGSRRVILGHDQESKLKLSKSPPGYSYSVPTKQEEPFHKLKFVHYDWYRKYDIIWWYWKDRWRKFNETSLNLMFDSN